MFRPQAQGLNSPSLAIRLKTVTQLDGMKTSARDSLQEAPVDQVLPAGRDFARPFLGYFPPNIRICQLGNSPFSFLSPFLGRQGSRLPDTPELPTPPPPPREYVEKALDDSDRGSHPSGQSMSHRVAIIGWTATSGSSSFTMEPKASTRGASARYSVACKRWRSSACH